MMPPAHGDAGPFAGKGISPNSDSSKARPAIILSGIMVMAAALRLYQYDARALNFDEFMYGGLYMGAPNAWKHWILFYTLYSPDVAPIYEMLQYWWASAFGPGAWTLKLLPILIGLTTIPIIYFVGSALYGYRAGLVAAFCLAVSPMQIVCAQTSRPYVLLLPLVLVSIYALLRAADSGSIAWWFVSCLVDIIMVWNVFISGLFVPVTCLFIAIARRKSFKQVLLWGFIKGLCLVPSLLWFKAMPYTREWHFDTGLLPAIVDIVGRDVYFNWQVRHPFEVFSLLADGCGFNPSAVVKWVYEALPDLAVTLWFVLALAWLMARVARLTLTSRRQLQSFLPHADLLLLLVAAGPALLLFCVTDIIKRGSYFPRYLPYSSLALYVALGAMLAGHPFSKLKKAAVLAFIACLAWKTSLVVPPKPPAQWPAAADAVRSRACSNDVVLVAGEWGSAQFFEYSSGNLRLPILSAGTFQAASDAAAFFLLADPSAAANPPLAVWLVLQHHEYMTDHIEVLDHAFAALGLAADSVSIPGASDNIIVYRITRGPDPHSVSEAATVIVREPYTFNAFDVDAFMADSLLTPLADAQRDEAREVVRRTALHFFYDKTDYVFWSASCLAAGRADVALAFAQKAIAIDPKVPLAHLMKGLALDMQGGRKGAIDSVAQAFKIQKALECVFAPCMNALVENPNADTALTEIRTLEKMGCTLFTPALFSLWRHKFAKDIWSPPVGTYALREASQHELEQRFAGAGFSTITNPTALRHLAQTLTLLGRTQEAATLERRAFDVGKNVPLF